MDNDMVPFGSLPKSARLTELVTQYQNLIYTVCLKITGIPSDAEDLTQDTFVKAYLSLDSFDGIHPKAWLCKIAVNTSLDHLKSIRARPPAEPYEENVKTLEAREDIQRMAEHHETLEQLQQALNSMPAKYATLLRRIVHEGAGVAEIAREDKLSVRTVETRLYRARKMLKERWDRI